MVGWVAAVVGWVAVVVCGGGLVAGVAVVTVLGVDSVNSSNFTRRRLSRVVPTATLSNTSASERVARNTLEIFTAGVGGGTVGHVTDVVGVVTLGVVGVFVVMVGGKVVADVVVVLVISVCERESVRALKWS